MKQLMRYITLLKYNNTFDVLNTLQDIEHNNRVFQYSPDHDIIILNGEWWTDFLETHMNDEATKILQTLHKLFNANYLQIVFEYQPSDLYSWENYYQMYLSVGGVCKNK
jgi:hypothetical protein